LLNHLQTAGKTELINYLFGKDVRRTGIGSPTTPIGFHREDLIIAGIPTSIWDSAGLEVGDQKEWMRALREELSERGLTQPIERWFHTVLYCVQAPGARIEPFEIQLINQFLDERYNVIVVIKKSYISERKREELVAAIKQQPLSKPLSYVYVNSKDEEIAETVLKRFGRNQLMNEIRIALIVSLTERVPVRCIRFMEEYVDKQCEELIDYVYRSVGSKRKNDISNYVVRKVEELLGDVRSPRGHLHHIICMEMITTVSMHGEIAGIVEQAIAFVEDTSVVGEVSSRVCVPKVGGFWKGVASGYLSGFESAFDSLSDLLHKNILIHECVSQAVSAFVTGFYGVPVFGIDSIVSNMFDFIEFHMNYKEEMIRRIRCFNEVIRQELGRGEHKIRSFFSERLRQI